MIKSRFTIKKRRNESGASPYHLKLAVAQSRKPRSPRHRHQARRETATGKQRFLGRPEAGSL